MPRLMAVGLTEQAVVRRDKTVTRRLGWRNLKPGDRVTLCRKVQGRFRRPDLSIEPLVRLAEVEVVSVRREPLAAITDDEVTREGFYPLNAFWFVEWFCEQMRCKPDTEVTRIEWRYLDAPCSGCGGTGYIDVGPSADDPLRFMGSVECPTCGGPNEEPVP